MKGLIGFENHRIDCIIGVEEQERHCEQPLFVDLKAQIDFSDSISTDTLEETVDYVLLAEVCTEIARHRAFQLIEKLAGEILKEILQRFKVDEVWIKIKKPQGISSADFSFVELSKKR